MRNGGALGPDRSAAGLRMQAPIEEFFTLVRKAGSNLAERVAIILKARAGSVIAAGAM